MEKNVFLKNKQKKERGKKGVSQDLDVIDDVLINFFFD